MSVMDRLAYNLGRKDDVPNQELAKELAETKNTSDIERIAAGLQDKERRIQSNCIKVLYEIGYIDPSLIAAYSENFVNLLRSSNNRLVWGSMTALSTIAGLKAHELYPHHEEIIRAVDKGSVITQDAGIKALADIAGADSAYRETLFPYLLDHLANCRPKDVAQRAEKIVTAVDTTNRQEFTDLVRKRMEYLKPSQVKRLEKVLRSVEET
jgi:hypothetical protein